MPKQVSELWDSRRVDHCVREAVKDFLRELHDALFPKHNSQFGAILNHHFWATKLPLEAHRHVHLTIPNVCYNRRADTFHRIRPYVDKGVVKRVWKSCLKKNGLWFDIPDHVEPVVWVGYVKFENRDKVLHRLSYCCRRPIEDLAEKVSDDDLDGDFDKEFALFLLDFTPRIINLGFLTNLKRFGYSRKSSSLKCPICGGDMVIVRDDYGQARLFDRPPPSIPRLYKNRQGTWQRVLE